MAESVIIFVVAVVDRLGHYYHHHDGSAGRTLPLKLRQCGLIYLSFVLPHTLIPIKMTAARTRTTTGIEFLPGDAALGRLRVLGAFFFPFQ